MKAVQPTTGWPGVHATGSHGAGWSTEELGGWCPTVGSVVAVDPVAVVAVVADPLLGAGATVDVVLVLPVPVAVADWGPVTDTAEPTSKPTIPSGRVGSACIMTVPDSDWSTVSASASPLALGW